MDLAQRHCTPCQAGQPPLTGEALRILANRLGHDWQLVGEHHLTKEFRFKDFRQAMDFTNRVGALAELEGHHPDIELSWGRVGITLFTHKIKGLSDNDFILAARIEEIPRPER